MTHRSPLCITDLRYAARYDEFDVCMPPSDRRKPLVPPAFHGTDHRRFHGCQLHPPPVKRNAPTSTPPSAQLGTVEPAYPVGADLAPDIEAIETIPVTELSTAKPVPLDPAEPCAGVPADVVNQAGVAATPVYSSEFGCVWRGPALGLEIGALPGSMAKEVEAHLAMANGGSTDQLAHLAWLRVDGNYAIERILEFNSSEGCWLTLDVSAPATVHAVMYRIDPVTGEPTGSDTDTSLRELCPLTRQVAKNLIEHFDGEESAWWENIIRPTR